jgi:hypothetical protein
MATPKPVERKPLSVVTRLDLDFGDAGLVVQEFSDGMFAVEVDGYRLLVNTEQMQEIVGAFDRLGKEQGWT